MNKGLALISTPASEEWETPPDLYTSLDEEFNFTLDPCASETNHKCRRYFTREQDGLKQPWVREIVFMNPPYGREICMWVEKAYRSAIFDHSVVVGLIPARTDSRWWHQFVQGLAEIRFIRGRIKFVGALYNAPFPSVIVVWRPNVG